MRILGLDVRVLLVDDSAVMRKVLLRSLASAGLDRVVEANDGAEALRLFEPGRFGLVLTDWNMPILDGLDVVKGIREQDNNVPIIMITTVAARHQVVDAIEAGISDYLIKPFDSDVLVEKLKRIASTISHGCRASC